MTLDIDALAKENQERAERADRLNQKLKDGKFGEAPPPGVNKYSNEAHAEGVDAYFSDEIEEIPHKPENWVLLIYPHGVHPDDVQGFLGNVVEYAMKQANQLGGDAIAIAKVEDCE